MPARAIPAPAFFHPMSLPKGDKGHPGGLDRRMRSGKQCAKAVLLAGINRRVHTSSRMNIRAALMLVAVVTTASCSKESAPDRGKNSETPEPSRIGT